MSGVVIWNVDPELLKLGPITIRYYGLLFVAALLIGFYLFRWQMLRAKYDKRAV